jgi:8-oxo-dGTP pyrophosphatase MutT (NUDIX family)
VADGFDLEALQSRVKTVPIFKTDEELPVAAVAIIINPKDRGGSILLIKRTEKVGDRWSGQVAFPGGRKTPRDRDFFETAVREAKEEVGIDLSEHQLLGRLPPVATQSRLVQVAPYIFQLKSPVVVRANEEVADSFWVPLSVLATIPSSQALVNVENGPLRVDCYTYNGHVIWGLTFRIINLLLNRT